MDCHKRHYVSYFIADFTLAKERLMTLESEEGDGNITILLFFLVPYVLMFFQDIFVISIVSLLSLHLLLPGSTGL